MAPTRYLSGDQEDLEFCPPLCVTKYSLFRLAGADTEAASPARGHTQRCRQGPAWGVSLGTRAVSTVGPAEVPPEATPSPALTTGAGLKTPR